MGRRRIAVAAGVAIALSLASASCLWRQQSLAESRRAALEAELAAILEDTRAQARIPGVSAAFALPDGRVGAAAAGFADVERGDVMTPRSRFLAGSVGKSFHAALAIALHREGTLDLDAPISRWVGDEAWFRRLPNGSELTLRILLRHTSGIVNHLQTPSFWFKSLAERFAHDADALLAAEELIEIALDREPRFAAGTDFAYGDTNYVVAGVVIERATGSNPFSLIEERLLEPLALDAIAPARARRVPELAAGYQLPVNPFLLPPKIAENGALRVHPMNESTAGGFATTPSDLVRWYAALFEERALPGRYLDELVGDPVATGDGRRYGLGVYVYDTPLGPAWGHGGYFPGYRSGALYFPEARVAVCVQVNRDFWVDVDALLLEIAGRMIASSTPQTLASSRH